MKTLLPALKARLETLTGPGKRFGQVDIAPDAWWRGRLNRLAFPFVALYSIGETFERSQISNHTDQVLRVKLTVVHRTNDPEGAKSAMFDPDDGIMDSPTALMNLLFEDPSINQDVRGTRLPFEADDFEILDVQKGNIASLYAVARRHRMIFVRQFDGQEWNGMVNPAIRII